MIQHLYVLVQIHVALLLISRRKYFNFIAYVDILTYDMYMYVIMTRGTLQMYNSEGQD